MKKLQIHTLFKNSLEIYKENWFDFLMIGVLLTLVNVTGKFTSLSFDPYTGGLNFGPSGFVGIIIWIASIYLGIGIIRYMLELIDGKKVAMKRIFHGVDSIEHFVYFILVGFISSFIIGALGVIPIGTFVVLEGSIQTYTALKLIFILVLFIPAIIAAIGLMFSKYYVAENKGSILESLKKSWALTHDHKLNLLWLMFVIMAFNALGFLAFGIGLIITIPVSSLVIASAYRYLETQTSHKKKTDPSVLEAEIIEEK